MISHIVWNVSPEIIDGFAFFRWYGISWMLGVLIGRKIMINIYERENNPIIEVDKLTLYIMLGAIAGARLGHILFYDPIYYLNNPIEILPFRIDPEFEFTGFAGLASHGGVIGALIALYFCQKSLQRNYLWLLDRLTIAAAALGGFIRLGNLMNSEMIGTPTDLPWAFVFERIDEIPRHPSQFYEAIVYFIVMIILYLVWKSKRFYDMNGFIFGLGLTMIFSWRFLVEFIKEDQVPFEGDLVLNMGQLLSIPLVAVGIGLMLFSRRMNATRFSNNL